MPNGKSSDPESPHLRDGKPAICVFCGSSHGNDPAFAQTARELGRAIGEQGFALVFGGGGLGLMGEVARAARDAGAPVTGILPEFLRHIEPPLRSGGELVVTPDLQLRKTEMMARADAFVILPGGLGTLDEYFEVVTTAQLDVHFKPIIVVDLNGFFAPLATLLEHVVAHGFAQPAIMAHHVFVPSVSEAMAVLNARLKPRPV
ncbi:MAG TPA: TIGR00730 family Rossman fold protein [Rhizomicrobium sp.]|jgi:hypothetical protein